MTPEGSARLEVRCTRLPAAMTRLAELEYVYDATIFADSLHVLVRAGSEARIARDVDAFGFGPVRTAPIPPTLEDVFVTLTRNRGGNQHV